MAEKMFDYAVIFNGVFYPAHTPIEVCDEPIEVCDEPIEEAPAEGAEKKPTKRKKAVKADDDKSAN
jgi:hypothetical protein